MLLVYAVCKERAGFASRIAFGFPGVALVPRLPLATGCDPFGIGRRDTRRRDIVAVRMRRFVSPLRGSAWGGVRGRAVRGLAPTATVVAALPAWKTNLRGRGEMMRMLLPSRGC